MERRFVAESGQGVLEYVLLLMIVFSIFTMLWKAVGQMNLAETLLKPLKVEYANAFTYGDIKGGAPQSSATKTYPIYPVGGGNRVFINPASR